MATNHTENYNLNLWEPNDKFVREEFNENTNKIDAALACHPSAELIWSQTVAEDNTYPDLVIDVSNVDWGRYLALALVLDASEEIGFCLYSGGSNEHALYVYNGANYAPNGYGITGLPVASHAAILIPVFYSGSHAPMAMGLGSSSKEFYFGAGGAVSPLSQCEVFRVRRWNGAFSPGDKAVLWGIK